MPLAEYQGPDANHVEILRYLVGEKIKAIFIDGQGHVWVIVPSGHALRFAGFDSSAPAFMIVPPAAAQQEIDKRRLELQAKILELRHLAPGIEL